MAGQQTDPQGRLISRRPSCGSLKARPSSMRDVSVAANLHPVRLFAPAGRGADDAAGRVEIVPIVACVGFRLGLLTPQRSESRYRLDRPRLSPPGCGTALRSGRHPATAQPLRRPAHIRPERASGEAIAASSPPLPQVPYSCMVAGGVQPIYPDQRLSDDPRSGLGLGHGSPNAPWLA